MNAIIQHILAGVGSIVCINPFNSVDSHDKIKSQGNSLNQIDGIEYDWEMVENGLKTAFL